MAALLATFLTCGIATAASEDFFPQQRPVVESKIRAASQTRLKMLSEPLPASAGRAIESLISPEHLFPIEGTVFKEHATGEDVAYRPLDAFDAPNGNKVGTVELTGSACFEATEKQAPCTNAGIVYFAGNGGDEHSLSTVEWSYETRGLVSYSAPSTGLDGRTWHRIEFNGGDFWVTTDSAFVFNVDSLAVMVNPKEQWCRAPGSCAPLSTDMKKSLADLASGKVAVLGCYPEAYEIKGIVSFEGQKYYAVTRADLAPFAPAATLPATGFVPVRTRTGAHTGSVYPRGC